MGAYMVTLVACAILTSYSISPQGSQLSVSQYPIGSLYGTLVGEMKDGVLRNIHGTLKIYGRLEGYELHIKDGTLYMDRGVTRGYIVYSISNSRDTFDAGTFFVYQRGTCFSLTQLSIAGRQKL